MSLLYLAGPRFNLVENAVSVTPSPSADSLFPTANLYDRNPGSIFKFGSLTSAPSVTFDLDLLGGFGGMENWTGTTPNGWTEVNTGVGHVDEQVGAPLVDGAKSAEFDNDDGGAATSSLHRDVVVRPGQRLTINSGLACDSVSGDDMLLRIRNQDTGNYLDINAGWQTAAQHVQPNPSGSGGAIFDLWSTAFSAESYTTTGKTTTTLRVQLFAPMTGAITYADAVTLIPAVSFCSIHGHNIDPRSAPVLQSSPDNSAWTTRATFSVQRPSMYVSFSPLYFRYWRILFADTNSADSGAIYMGEVVLGDYSTSATGPAYNLGLNFSDPQVRVPVRVGAPATYALGQSYQRRLPLKFRCENKTRQREILTLWEMSRGGHPVVIVPHDADSFTDVIYGRMSPELPHVWETKNYVGIETEVEEMAFPLVTS